MALEFLHFQLTVFKADADEYPKSDDSIWASTWIDDLFFMKANLVPDDQRDPFPRSLMRDILFNVVEGEINNDTALQNDAIASIPNGWQFRHEVFETARNCALLEYYFIYAYNDYDRYEPWPANYHEGDDEGCCYVFDRRSLETVSASGNLDDLLNVEPLFVITSVHLERQDADRIKEFDRISQNEVFVAAGSHATYLTPGSHDFLSFGDAFEEGFDVPPVWLNLLTGGALGLTIGLLTAIGEHFRDSNDETSESGIAAGSDDQLPPDLVGDPRVVEVEIEVTPLSLEENIFRTLSAQATDSEDARLGLLSFAGKLGDHAESLGNESPFFVRKTGRFFRKLIKSGKQI
jgi:hypothetical protein